MAMFAWNENLSVEIQVMDEQHRYLFDLMNRLEDAVKGGEETAVCQAIERLAACAEVHFADEEGLLDLHDYQDLKRQRLQHRFFTGQMAALDELLRRGDSLRLQSLLDYLRGWLIQHIFREDKKYGTCLESAAAIPVGAVTLAVAAAGAT